MSNWISVKDRLPENEHIVIVACKSENEKYTDIVRYSQKKLRWEQEIINFFDRLEWLQYPYKDEITHWQPLPEPPKD